VAHSVCLWCCLYFLRCFLYRKSYGDIFWRESQNRDFEIDKIAVIGIKLKLFKNTIKLSRKTSGITFPPQYHKIIPKNILHHSPPLVVLLVFVLKSSVWEKKIVENANQPSFVSRIWTSVYLRKNVNKIWWVETTISLK